MGHVVNLTGGAEPQALDRFLSAQQCADAIGVTKASIYLWTRDGEFPQGLKVGKKTFWRQSEVARWMASRPPLVQRPLPAKPDKPAPLPVPVVSKRRAKAQ